MLKEAGIQSGIVSRWEGWEEEWELWVGWGTQKDRVEEVWDVTQQRDQQFQFQQVNAVWFT